MTGPKKNRKFYRLRSLFHAASGSLKFLGVKEGENTVKVPLTDGQGNKQGWSDHKSNNWRIENQGAMGIKSVPFDKLKPLDTPEQLLKQQRGFSLFKQNQEATVKLQEKQKLGIRLGIFKF